MALRLGRGGKRPGAKAAMDTVDALTARLADVSQHAVIDLGTGATAVDFSHLDMKPDHERRPFWITPTGSVFLEASSPLYEQARDFLVAICEPVSRPDFVHEYRLDKNALFAAASMGLTGELIISALSKLSKVPLSESVVDFVEACTSGYGKVKLVLKRGRYFVESSYPALLRLLASHPTIRGARVWYAPDGRRVVGSDGERFAASNPFSSAGFEVSHSLSETEGSLGLSGLVGGAGGAGGKGGAGVLPMAGDTAGGMLVARVRGEVDSDEEDGGKAPAPTPAGRPAASPQAAAGAGASSSSFSFPAAPAPVAAPSHGGFSPDELDSLLAAVDEVEAALAEAETERAAGGDGSLTRAKYPNVSHSSLSAPAAPDVGTRRMTSFASDMTRLGLAAAPTTSAAAGAPLAPLTAVTPSTSAGDTVLPGMVSVGAPAGSAALKLRMKVTGAQPAEPFGGPAKPGARPGPFARGSLGAGGGNGGSDSESDSEDDWDLDRLLSDEEEELAEMGLGRSDGNAAGSKSGAGKGKAGTAKGGARKRRRGDDGTYGDDGGDDADDDVDEDEGFKRKKKGAAKGKKVTPKLAQLGPEGEEDEDEEGDELSTFSARMATLRAQLGRLHSSARVESFEIDGGQNDTVRKACLYLDPPLPLMQEYDFRGDSALPSLSMALRDASMLRPYQQRSLAKMFGNGRARSGIIVLPCGAGKTLVGIAAATTLGKSCIVMCPNQTSVAQWVESFVRFTDVKRSCLVTLTSKKKEPLPPLHEAVVLLTTYSMIGSGGRGKESAAVLRDIAAREWGLLLLDEVHQVVANTFSRVLRLRAHCRLGLTATLVREDGRDRSLSHLIGPKLYEANWRDLTRAGYLANVQVVEVWCPMPPAFYREYLRCDGINTKKALAVMNPTKCWAMDRLLAMHEARGDKIIVFSESVFALKLYAERYSGLAIYGDTRIPDRETFIRAFKTPNSGVNKLFLSRVGDVALDVPDANVIIQISSHFGSRLQEAQRMGRILRRGSAVNASSGANSFFYTLISTDTLETYFANKRRRYLVDQGYAYVVRPADALADKAAVEMLAREHAEAMGQVNASGTDGEGGEVPAPAPVKRGFVLDNAQGLEALRLSSRFMQSHDEQLRVLKLTLQSNIDALEEGESKFLASELESSHDMVVREAKDNKRAAKLAAAQGSGAGTSGLGGQETIATRTLTGRPSLAPPSAVPAPVRRALSGLAALSGGAGLAYLEYTTSHGGAADALEKLEAGEAAERAVAIQAARLQRAAGGPPLVPKQQPARNAMDAL